MAFLSGWQKRVKLTVPGASVSGLIPDFPVFVNRACLPDEVCDPSSPNAAQADGGDLRVTAADGVTVLPLEIAAFGHDSSSGAGDAQVRLWFLAPLLSTSGDKEFYLYYNAETTQSQPAVTDPTGRNAVWADFYRVYHLDEESGNFIDSTGSSADGVVSGTVTRGASVGALKGVDFGATGHTNYIDAPSLGDQSTMFAVSCWVDLDATQGNWCGIVSDGDDVGNGGIVVQREFNTNDLRVYYNGLEYYNDLTSAFSSIIGVGDTLLHVAVTPDSLINVYKNAFNIASDTTQESSATAASAPTLKIGNARNGGNGIGGVIAELRIRPGAITAARMEAERDNQSLPTAFITTGSPESTAQEYTVTGTDGLLLDDPLTRDLALLLTDSPLLESDDSEGHINSESAFIQDSFTDSDNTLLENHSETWDGGAGIGGGWDNHTDPLISAKIVSGSVQGDSGGSGDPIYYSNTATPPDENYAVEAVVTALSLIHNEDIWVLTRFVDIENFHWAGIKYSAVGGGQFLLQGSFFSGSVTLGSAVQGQSYTLRIEGDANTLRVLVDGEEKAVGDAGALLAAGRAGVSPVDIGAWAVDDFQAIALTAQPVTDAPVIGIITATDTTATVTYTGVANATRYEYRIDGGDAVSVAKDSPLAVTGLVAGTQYTIELRGASSAGIGPWSSLEHFVTRLVEDSFTDFVLLQNHTVTGAGGAWNRVNFNDLGIVNNAVDFVDATTFGTYYNSAQILSTDRAIEARIVNGGAAAFDAELHFTDSTGASSWTLRITESTVTLPNLSSSSYTPPAVGASALIRFEFVGGFFKVSVDGAELDSYDTGASDISGFDYLGFALSHETSGQWSIDYLRALEIGGSETVYVEDDFTDGVSLASHTPDIGSTWVLQDGAGPVLLQNNTIGADTTNEAHAFYGNAVTPLSADYLVEVDVIAGEAAFSGQEAIGVLGRLSADGTATEYYRAGIGKDASGDPVVALSSSAGAISEVPITFPAAGESKTLRLEMEGDSIRVYWDGTKVIDVTNTDVTAIGRAGIAQTNYSGTAWTLDNFVAEPFTLGDSIYLVTATDGLLMLDPAVRDQLDTMRDALLLGDAAIRTQLAVLSDSLLFGDSTTKGRLAALRDSLLFGDTVEAAPVINFLFDSFTDAEDTEVTSHTPEIGGAITKLGTADTALIRSNRLQGPDASTATVEVKYLYAATPPSADYAVEAVCVATGTVASSSVEMGLIARSDGTQFGGYRLVLSATSTTLTLYLTLGTGPELGSYAVGAIGDHIDVPHTIRLECVGDSIKAYLDDVERISATDTTHTAAGVAGITLSPFSGLLTVDSLRGTSAERAQGPGPQVFTVTATDGLVMLDPSTKDEEHTATDAFTLASLLKRSTDKSITDQLLMGDSTQRVIDKAVVSTLLTGSVMLGAFEKVIRDGMLIGASHSAKRLVDRLVTDYFLLGSDTTKDLYKILTDSPFIASVVGTLASNIQLYLISETDSLLLRDEISKAVVTGASDSLLIGDATIREQLALVLDRVLLSESLSKELARVQVDQVILDSLSAFGFDVSHEDRVLLDTRKQRVVEKLLFERLYVNDTLAMTTALDRIISDRLFINDADSLAQYFAFFNQALVFASLGINDLMGITLGAVSYGHPDF